MNAIKAARAFTGRDRIVKMDSAYHGSYEGVEFDGPSDSANGAVPATQPDTPSLHDPLPAEHKVVQTWRSPAPTSRGVPRSMAENVLTIPFDDCDAARRLVTRHRHEIAVCAGQSDRHSGWVAPAFAGVSRVLARGDAR